MPAAMTGTSGAAAGSGGCDVQAVSTSECTAEPAAIWIFGYGSLVYKQQGDFEFDEAVQGYIKGWRRVWHQGSTDHRGTPEAPGRTVTLVEDSESVTWGVAFRLAGTPEQQAAALAALEWREKQYDIRHRVDVFVRGQPHTPTVAGAMIYIGSPDRTKNVNYAGPAPLEVIAATIATAVGPSGPNHEYLFRLAEAMRQMKVHDAELFQLESHVRSIMQAAASGTSSAGTGRSSIAVACAAATSSETLQDSDHPPGAGKAAALQPGVSLVVSAACQQTDSAAIITLAEQSSAAPGEAPSPCIAGR